MMALTPKSIKEDIDGLISELIGKGVCDDSNFSAIRSSGGKADVTFSGSEHVSIALGDIEYAEIYRELADKLFTKTEETQSETAGSGKALKTGEKA